MSLSVDLTNRFRLYFILTNMRISLNVLWKNMTSCNTDDLIPGKHSNLTRTAKSGVNIIRFLSKFQNIIILGQVVAV